MSEHLGKVHYMMYDKMKMQDKITAFLLSKEELDKLGEVIPPIATEDLSLLIDSPNIHGWLSARIDIVEARLSYALSHTKDVAKKMYDFGFTFGQGKTFENIQAFFQDLSMLLLDGMPCDKGLKASLDEDGKLYLIQNIDLHEDYAHHPLLTDPMLSLDKTCAGDHDHDDHGAFHLEKGPLPEDISSDEVSLFHQARFALLQGYAKATGYEVKRMGNKNYLLEKK